MAYSKTPTRITFVVPIGMASEVSRVLYVCPVEHPDRPGVKSDNAMSGSTPGGEYVVLTFPEPEPDIPALIRRWRETWAEDDRRALWVALSRAGGTPRYWGASWYSADDHPKHGQYPITIS